MNFYSNPPVVPPQRENGKIGVSESTYPALDPEGNEAMEYPAELSVESTQAKLGPLWESCGEYLQSNFTPKSRGKAFGIGLH